jgi:SAM-dependent methyltransferase
MSETPNAAQAEYWNETAGPVWTSMQVQLDRQTGPLGAAAIRALAPAPGERILDIGCGCGASSWELAALVGEGGSVVGVDLSRPMLEVARGRGSGGPTPDFREGDAQAGDLGERAFDAAFSRFGVMFFSDPTAAFANVRRSVKPGGRLAFVCWRPMTENPLMYAAAVAAAPFVPLSPPSDPTAPGPFAFADPARVRGVLASAGWSEVSIEPFDTTVGGSSLDEAVALALRIGPLGAALREAPPAVDQVRPAVRARLETYLTREGVMFPAAVWIVTAFRSAQ